MQIKMTVYNYNSEPMDTMPLTWHECQTDRDSNAYEPTGVLKNTMTTHI